MLEGASHAIGDFNMIDGTTGLIIERDNGEGTADKACPEGQKHPDCFHGLAKFKRVYKIELSQANVGAAVRKIGYIDLMVIADPNRLARKPLNNGVLTFPFSRSKTWMWWMPRTSSWAMTTTCRFRAAASRTRPTTTR